MRVSVAVAKEADAKKGFSPTKSDNSIHRVRNEPERQLGSLRDVIGNIRHEGGKPSVESIATELSGVHATQRAPALLALQQTHGNRYVQLVVSGIQAKQTIMQRNVQRSCSEDAEQIKRAAVEGVSGSGGRLPYREKIQASFGVYDVTDVQAHIGGAAGKASDAIGATAYATGNHVAFKEAPDLRNSAHEAAHLVQQRGGIQLKGGMGHPGDSYERHADAVADRVVQGRSAEDLLSSLNGREHSTEVQMRNVQKEELSQDRIESMISEESSSYSEDESWFASVLTILGVGSVAGRVAAPLLLEGAAASTAGLAAAGIAAAAIGTIGGLIVGVVSHIYRTYQIQRDSEKVATASGFTDAILPLTFAPARQPAVSTRGMSDEAIQRYMQGFEEGGRWLSGLATSDRRQLASFLNGLRVHYIDVRARRREIFNAAYGEGTFRQRPEYDLDF